MKEVSSVSQKRKEELTAAISTSENLIETLKDWPINKSDDRLDFIESICMDWTLLKDEQSRLESIIQNVKGGSLRRDIAIPLVRDILINLRWSLQKLA